MAFARASQSRARGTRRIVDERAVHCEASQRRRHQRRRARASGRGGATHAGKAPGGSIRCRRGEALIELRQIGPSLKRPRPHADKRRVVDS
ncbi:hypothetical protein HPB50_026706 [Hyalomma asiaticum]|uniref:Uncharacterized protein n=1 Tax=Hyalomma asiaticum TaxID=266040 RepID=A0ACB7SD19_HYAAI|nr:hypothetical protein HPB50_026706 [Hyalomma asiaticum]